jgi:hypothetical protein
MDNFPIDGSLPLADQRNTLRFIELGGPFKLLTYVKKAPQAGSTQKVNVASFSDVGPTVKVPDLILVAVGPGDNSVSIIADQIADGKQVIFHEHVFVSGSDQEVLGFR